jgi:hypothetical protein
MIHHRIAGKWIGAVALSKDIVVVLGALSVIGGSLAYLYDKYDQRSNERIRNTLVLVDEFRSQEMTQVRFKLAKPWQRDDLASLVKMSPQSHEMLIVKTIAAMSPVEKDEYQFALVRMVGFLENLEICVSHDICDRELSLSYFGGYANQLRCWHGPTINQMRQLYRQTSFAKQLDAFANRLASCT